MYVVLNRGLGVLQNLDYYTCNTLLGSCMKHKCRKKGVLMVHVIKLQWAEQQKSQLNAVLHINIGLFWKIFKYKQQPTILIQGQILLGMELFLEPQAKKTLSSLKKS